MSDLNTAPRSAGATDPKLKVDLMAAAANRTSIVREWRRRDVIGFVPGGPRDENLPDVRGPFAERPAFAESPAYHTLLREMRKYLNGEIRGRSFLIAGHRGAGKTSMVLRAVEDLQAAAMTGDAGAPREQRPLLVRLHGPGLLAAVSGAAEKPLSGENKADENSGPAQQDPVAKVLAQIMISVYRALTAETVRCFRQRMDGLQDRGAHLRDPVEIAGQLSLELDSAPPPELLRDYWRRAGALTGGIFWPFRRNRHQGMRELVALSTAAQAYRVVTGAVTYKSNEKIEATAQQSAERNVNIDGKAIADKVLGVLTGGLVAGAYWSENRDQVLATVVIGLATALISSWTFKFTSKRDRKSTASHEYTFIRQSDVSTLDRELPVVIERIREAGLAPVFVVDELDKVDKLEDTMADLVKRLKHIVADRSFFCFLTDRDYFEHLQEKSRRLPYPEEHTYFSHRLFVHYRPDNLHDYLDRIIVDAEKYGDTDHETLLFRELLSYLVMHRAMMHVFDLQRELAKVCDESGTVTVRQGELLSHYGYRFHIMIQLAVEHLLAEDKMRDRLDQDPHFGQLAYDALYYITRGWADGKETLDLSEEALHAYLARRIDPVWAEQQRNGHPSQDSRTAGEVIDETVNETDRVFLVESIERLADLLADSEALNSELAEARRLGDFQRDLLNLIPRQDRPLLIREANGIRWRHDYFGRELLSKEDRVREEDQLPETITSALAMADALRDLEGRIGEVTETGIGFEEMAIMNLLPRSPDWEEVSDAADRLLSASMSKVGPDSKTAMPDARLIHEFTATLIDRGPLIVGAIALAGEIGRRTESDRWFANGIDGIFLCLSVRDLESSILSDEVFRLLGEAWPENDVPRSCSSVQEIGEELTTVTAALANRQIEDGRLREHVRDFWAQWLSHLHPEAIRGSTDRRRTVSELVLVAKDNDMRYAIDGLRNSSIKGLTAIATGSTSDEWSEGTIPAWAILWAFRQLEFHGVLKRLGDDEKALNTLARAFPWLELETDRESWRWVVDLPGMADRDADTRILIIAPSISSPPDWTAEPGIAALQLHMDSNRAAEPSVLKWVSERQRFTLALVDIGELDNADANRILRHFLDSPNNVVALSNGREAGSEIAGVPVIRYPNSIRQAVRAAREALEGYGYKPEPTVRRKT